MCLPWNLNVGICYFISSNFHCFEFSFFEFLYWCCGMTMKFHFQEFSQLWIFSSIHKILANFRFKCSHQRFWIFGKISSKFHQNKEWNSIKFVCITFTQYCICTGETSMQSYIVLLDTCTVLYREIGSCPLSHFMSMKTRVVSVFLTL